MRKDFECGFLFSGVSIYSLEKVVLGCVSEFPVWAIITIALGATLIIVIAVVVNRKWTLIKFHYYARFTNDDDSQDLSPMLYDAFVSYRLVIYQPILLPNIIINNRKTGVNVVALVNRF